MKHKDVFKCAVSGVLGGAANGLFGAGGGMVIVPLLCHWLKLPEKKAFATSLAIILPLSVISAVIYIIGSDFQPKDALPYVIGGIAGGVVGGFIFKKVSAKVLRYVFAGFMIYGGVRALFAL